MLKRLESEASELDERRRQLELEIRDWESSSGISLDELRRRSLEREYVIFLTCINIIILYLLINQIDTVYLIKKVNLLCYRTTDGKEKKIKKKGLF